MVHKHTENEVLEMYTVRLLLATTKYDEQIINKRFHAVSHIHNVLVKHSKKCLKKLSCDKEYQSLKAEYSAILKKNKISKEERAYKKQISRRMAEIVKGHGLSEYSFQAYIKICARQFRGCLSSQQVQKEATRVWRGTEKILYGNGHELHFKKFRDFNTICGKTNTNGVKFYKNAYFIEWLGLNIKCRLPKNRDYIIKALNSDISYCEIERKMFPNGWHYYVVIYLKGDAPHKLSTAENNDSITGVDIGVSTVAAVSENEVILKELAPRCKVYNRKIEKLQINMDISKRISNPDKYNPDGSIDRSNHEKWAYSKTYLKKLNRLKSLYRQKKAYIKQSHEEIINGLLEQSASFIVEDMSFKGLQHRAKKTERRKEAADIKQKDGSFKKVYKHRRKKRFGKSLNDRAPASFITILTRKANLYGGNVYKADTRSFRASQYNHVTDDYTKPELSERNKLIGGHKVQRDLYSAFLLRNSNKELNKPDRAKCICEFDRFLKLQNCLLTEMKENGISMKQCFGF